MKLNDYFKTTFILFFRDKSNIFNIILIAVTAIALLVIFIFKENFDIYVSKIVNSNYGFRTLTASALTDREDLGLDLIQKVDNIENVYNSKYDSITINSNYQNDKYDGYITLQYGGYNSNNVVKGKNKFSKNKNELICPINFYPDSNSYDAFKIKKENIINGEDLLGKEITLSYMGINDEPNDKLMDDYKLYEEKFEVIGLYDNSRVMNTNNQCYISFDSIKRIGDNKFGEDSNIYYGWSVVVDDINNVQQVKEKLENLGFSDVNIQSFLYDDTIQSVNKTLSIVKYVIIASQIAIIIFLMRKKVSKDSKNIGIFRNLGYRNNTIKLIYLGISVLNIIVSLVLGILFSFILFIILKNTIFLSFSYTGLDILYNYVHIFKVIGIIFISNFLCTILYFCLFLRKSLISVLK